MVFIYGFIIPPDGFELDLLHLLVPAFEQTKLKVKFEPNDKTSRSAHIILQGDNDLHIGEKIKVIGVGGHISLAMENKIDFGEVDARSVPFVKKTLHIFNDGELPVKILADSNNNQPFKMRENKRTGLFQSLEARFDDHIISIAYEKNHLFPGEKMEIDIYMYVVEYATIDTAIFIKLDSGSIDWKVRILAKGKPPAVSHDLLFLLQDLDDIDRMLRPLEVGRDVHFDAIIAQPDKILNVSLGHLLKPITPDVRRQGISYLTSMPVPATRFVIDPRTKRWYTDRKPLSFSKNGDNNDG